MRKHRQPRKTTLSAGLFAAFAVIFGLVAVAFGSSSAGGPLAEVAGPTTGPVVGLIAADAQWSNSTMAARLDTVISSTNTHWLREGFFWNEIEPTRGHYTFAHYDHFMVLAARDHENVLALLYQAPGWAARTPNTLPSDVNAYAQFVAAVVRRYGAGGTFWRAHPKLSAYPITTFDLWNEPYYDIGNNGAYDPALYAHLVKAAGSAAHAANRRAKVLMGAEMQGTFNRNHAWVWWVNALYQAVPNLNRYFNGVSVHPYGGDITGLAPDLPDRPYNGYNQMRRIQLIRRQFVAHGAASKPFFATEVGWPTCHTSYDRCVSPARQVVSLETLMTYSRTIWRDYMRGVFVYYYNDDPGSRRNPENDYGLTWVNGAPKPILKVFREYATRGPGLAWK